MVEAAHINLSFVIIGRNEEKNLKRCIDSILRAVKAAGITGWEIIYVDSLSTDKSIEIAASFPGVRIFQVTGGRNAAVGRNIGAKQAKGDVIFFVDGDMEVYSDFLLKYWNPETKNIDEPMIYGQWNDILEGVGQKRWMNDKFPGGTFLIRRPVWESVGGMRSRFKTGEEADLGLRLFGELGLKFSRKPEFIVNHHTVAYLHASRIWKQLTDKSIFFSRAVTYRHHFFNIYMYKNLLWINDKTFLLMLVTIILSIIFPLAGLVSAGLYLLMVMIRVRTNKTYLGFLPMTGYYILSDILNLYFFFTFYPKDIKEEFVEVQKDRARPNERALMG